MIKISSYRQQTGSIEFEIDTNTEMKMVEDLDMDNEHETVIKILHRIFKSWKLGKIWSLKN